MSKETTIKYKCPHCDKIIKIKASIYFKYYDSPMIDYIIDAMCQCDKYNQETSNINTSSNNNNKHNIYE